MSPTFDSDVARMPTMMYPTCPAFKKCVAFASGFYSERVNTLCGRDALLRGDAAANSSECEAGVVCLP